MLFNDLFTTYRRATSGVKRIYSATATVTNGYGIIVPLDGKMQATLGIDSAVKAYVLQTEETDIMIDDKVTSNSVNYYVRETETVQVQNIEITRALLFKM